jgi:hypothetical protein
VLECRAACPRRQGNVFNAGGSAHG